MLTGENLGSVGKNKEENLAHNSILNIIACIILVFGE